MATPPPRDVLPPFPEPRHLYMLIAGVLLGILLGPAVLGRVAPELHRNVFEGGGASAKAVADADADIDAQIERLRATGVTEIALEEHRLRGIEATLPQRLAAMEARTAHQRTIGGWMTAVLLTLALVMAIETLASPPMKQTGRTSVSPMVARLINVRYALLALWLALAIAQPTALRQIPLLFTGLLIAVALIIGLMPLGPATDEQEESAGER